MGCGCGGGRGNIRGVKGRGTGTYRSAPNRTITPTQRAALELKQNKKRVEEPQGMSLARREIARKHRLAVQRALGH